MENYSKRELLDLISRVFLVKVTETEIKEFPSWTGFLKNYEQLIAEMKDADVFYDRPEIITPDERRRLAKFKSVEKKHLEIHPLITSDKTVESMRFGFSIHYFGDRDGVRKEYSKHYTTLCTTRKLAYLELVNHLKSNYMMGRSVSGIGHKDAGLEVISEYARLHNKVVDVTRLEALLKKLQKYMTAGNIQSNHPYAKEILRIQSELVDAVNNCDGNYKVTLSNISSYKNIIKKEQSGLGFLPLIIAAAAGKTIEHLTHKVLNKGKEPENLGNPDPADPEPSQGKPVSLPAGGFVRADQKEKVVVPGNFRLPGELGKLLQDIQPYKYSIVITGDPHAGKTEFVFQLANAFAEVGKEVGMFSLEQGGMESKDTQSAVDRNIKPANLKHIQITGEAQRGIETLKAYAKIFPVIIVDSWQKLGIPSTKFDSLRHEFPNTIWVVIFQQNAEGNTRGGVAADYDTTVNLKVHKVDDTFKNNYVEVKKNRGNSLGFRYMLKAKKTLAN